MIDRTPRDAASRTGASPPGADDTAAPRRPGEAGNPEEVLARLLEYLARTGSGAPAVNGNGHAAPGAPMRRPVVILRHPMRMPRFADLRRRPDGETR